jgi:ABC-type branched-subunit amino acid transport system ATPase component
MVALLGANGAGKSTTLKAISNLLPFEGGRVRRGTIRFEGRDITNIPAYKLSRMGLIHVREGRRVFSTMTVHENLVAASYALVHGYVLDNGRSVLDGPARDLLHDPMVIERYLGGAGVPKAAERASA